MAESLADYEPLARDVLPTAVYDFVAGGSGSEQTLRRNRAAFDALTVTPRVLTGTAKPNSSWTVLGTRWELPFAVAPMAYQKLLHPEGSCSSQLPRRASASRTPSAP